MDRIDPSQLRWQRVTRRALGALERAAAELLPRPVTLSEALRHALRAVASGDLTVANLLDVLSTEEGRALESLVARVRALVTLGRRALGATPRAAEQVAATSVRVAELMGRQRVTLERTAEEVQRLSTRARELQALAREVAEAGDRAALLSLNAGIEGMRVGGESARALTLLGEEIRRLSQRAHVGALDLAAGVTHLEEGARSALGRLEEVQSTTKAVADAAMQASVAADQARRTEDELVVALDGWRVLDDETESLVGSITQAAARLTQEVSQLRARLRPEDVSAWSALTRALGPLDALTRHEGPARTDDVGEAPR
jgi:methyl-accepting chemotaxis protein